MPMDTFDSVALSVFLLLLSAVAARLTFWKAGRQLLSLRVILCPVLLCAIATLLLSTWHHWNAPHRRVYQLLLIVSSMVVNVGQFAMHYHEQMKAAQKKAEGIYHL